MSICVGVCMYAHESCCCAPTKLKSEENVAVGGFYFFVPTVAASCQRSTSSRIISGGSGRSGELLLLLYRCLCVLLHWVLIHIYMAGCVFPHCQGQQMSFITVKMPSKLSAPPCKLLWHLCPHIHPHTQSAGGQYYSRQRKINMCILFYQGLRK